MLCPALYVARADKKDRSCSVPEVFSLSFFFLLLYDITIFYDEYMLAGSASGALGGFMYRESQIHLYSVVLFNAVHDDMHVKPLLRQVEDRTSIWNGMLCCPNNRKTIDICFCVIGCSQFSLCSVRSGWIVDELALQIHHLFIVLLTPLCVFDSYSYQLLLRFIFQIKKNTIIL